MQNYMTVLKGGQVANLFVIIIQTVHGTIVSNSWPVLDHMVWYWSLFYFDFRVILGGTWQHTSWSTSIVQGCILSSNITKISTGLRFKSFVILYILYTFANIKLIRCFVVQGHYHWLFAGWSWQRWFTKKDKLPYRGLKYVYEFSRLDFLFWSYFFLWLYGTL